MRKSVFILLLIFFSACERNNPEAQIDYLNGYWEISKVENPYGIDKEYNFNPTVEFFEIENKEGIRKKVQPKLDGTYIVDGKEEKVTVKIEADSLRLYYNTGFDAWKETVIEANEEELVLKNTENKIFHYKKLKGYLNHEEME